jgi:hypothetical protein
VRSPVDSARRKRLKIDNLRDCGSGPASVAVGGIGEVCVRVRVAGGGGTIVVPEGGESGFAMRKPPRVCERLRSPSMATTP